jgi:hypothetical protein
VEPHPTHPDLWGIADNKNNVAVFSSAKKNLYSVANFCELPAHAVLDCESITGENKFLYFIQSYF